MVSFFSPTLPVLPRSAKLTYNSPAHTGSCQEITPRLVSPHVTPIQLTHLVSTPRPTVPPPLSLRGTLVSWREGSVGFLLPQNKRSFLASIGSYTGANGATSLFTVGETVTPQTPYSTPASSNCVTYTSVGNGEYTVVSLHA